MSIRIFVAGLAALSTLSACGPSGSDGGAAFNALEAAATNLGEQEIARRIKAHGYTCDEDPELIRLTLPTNRASMSTATWEISKLGYTVEPVELSSADQLNGFEFIGKVLFDGDTSLRTSYYDKYRNRQEAFEAWRSVDHTSIYGRPGFTLTLQEGEWRFGTMDGVSSTFLTAMFDEDTKEPSGPVARLCGDPPKAVATSSSVLATVSEPTRPATTQSATPATSVSEVVLAMLAQRVWTGPVSQPSSKTAYTMRVIQDDGRVLVEYPELSCGGVWELSGTQSDVVLFRERLSSGQSRCSDNGFVSLRVADNNTLNFEFRYSLQGAVSASATLRMPPSLPGQSGIVADSSNIPPRHGQGFMVEPYSPPSRVLTREAGSRYRAAPFANNQTEILGSTKAAGEALSITGVVREYDADEYDGVWYQVQLADGRFGYIRSDLTTVNLPGRYPVSGKVEQDFGVKWSEKDWKTHTGVDVAVPKGTPVPAMAGGKVVNVADLGKDNKGRHWGWAVIVEEASGQARGYLHVQPSVKKEDTIIQGAKVGTVLDDHLHYNVCKEAAFCQRGALPTARKDPENPDDPLFADGPFMRP